MKKVSEEIENILERTIDNILENLGDSVDIRTIQGIELRFRFLLRNKVITAISEIVRKKKNKSE